MEKRGRKISSLANLRVRGTLKADGEVIHKGIAIARFREYRATLHYETATDTLTVTTYQNDFNPLTWTHSTTGSWIAFFGEHFEFTRFAPFAVQVFVDGNSDLIIPSVVAGENHTTGESFAQLVLQSITGLAIDPFDFNLYLQFRVYL